jgi:sporulation protein YlmC with PRC-barrel domain
MKRILMTTALVAFAATTPAMAQDTTTGVLIIDTENMTSEGMQIDASNLMGKTVYINREGAAEDQNWNLFTDIPDTWEDVADVSDIMIDTDGRVGSIVLDAGGFLGMGETEKTVSIDNLRFVADTDNEGEYFVLYTGNRELLEGEADYDTTALESSGYRSASEGMTDGDSMTAAPAATEMPATGTDTAATDTTPAAPMDRASMTEASLAMMTTEELTGTPIYGVDDERLGEIGRMVLADGGTISDVIVDVGGFLGIGERHVALKLSEIALMQDEGGSVVGYVTMTKEQIEALEEWNKEM